MGDEVGVNVLTGWPWQRRVGRPGSRAALRRGAKGVADRRARQPAHAALGGERYGSESVPWAPQPQRTRARRHTPRNAPPLRRRCARSAPPAARPRPQTPSQSNRWGGLAGSQWECPRPRSRATRGVVCFMTAADWRTAAGRVNAVRLSRVGRDSRSTWRLTDVLWTPQAAKERGWLTDQVREGQEARTDSVAGKPVKVVKTFFYYSSIDQYGVFGC